MFTGRGELAARAPECIPCPRCQTLPRFVWQDNNKTRSAKCAQHDDNRMSDGICPFFCGEPVFWRGHFVQKRSVPLQHKKFHQAIKMVWTQLSNAITQKVRAYSLWISFYSFEKVLCLASDSEEMTFLFLPTLPFQKCCGRSGALLLLCSTGLNWTIHD